MINVELPVFPPHEKSPSFVKWVGGMSVKPDQVDTLIEILETLKGEQYPKIPFQVLEWKTGLYISCNVFKKSEPKESSDDFDRQFAQAKARSDSAKAKSNDIDLSSIPF